MGDPREGLTTDGLICTGAAAARITTPHKPVLDAARGLIAAAAPDTSLYVYGSVATGQAVVPTSDVDLLTIGLSPEAAVAIAARLSVQFDDLCRSVDIAAAQPADMVGDHDEAYGNRIFLRHYCVHLAGPDPAPVNDFPGNKRAARAFNGDIAQHTARWQAAQGQEDPSLLGRRIARKLLLAVAGLVSVHDGTWTTDRDLAAARWTEVHPALAGDLALLQTWTAPDSSATRAEVDAAVPGVVATIVGQFTTEIGLW